MYELGLIGPNREQEAFLDEWTFGTWEFDLRTGLVNIDGNFECTQNGLTDFKGIQLGRVTGDCWLSNNALTSLEGGPTHVGGDFICYGNNLTSLEGAPRTVNGYFNCAYNYLTLTPADLQSLEVKVAGKIIFDPQKKTRIT